MLSQVGAPLRKYVAGSDFVANRDLPELGVKVGERVPWRDLGIHEVKMHELWRANIVDCAPPSVQVAVKVAPTERVDVTPPRHKRR